MYIKWNNCLFMDSMLIFESYDHTIWCSTEFEFEDTVEGFGTANLSRLVSSPNLKSVSEKCRQ